MASAGRSAGGGGAGAGAGAGAGSGAGAIGGTSDARLDDTLGFVSGLSQRPSNVRSIDSDIYSWIIMNQDLFPTPDRSEGAALAAAGAPASGGPDFDGSDNIGASYATLAGAGLLPAAPAASGSAGPATTVDDSMAGSVAGGAGGSGGGSVDGADTGDSKLDKRQRRLEKNREIARNCRKRKRERMQDLEERVKELTAAKKKLELRLKVGYDVEKREDTRLKQLQEIERMTREGKSSDEINAAIRSYKDVFSDYGEERRSAIKYHLEQLKMLLLPTQVTKMAMWSLHQDDAFYEEGGADVEAGDASASLGGGIWDILCKELKITDEQKRHLMEVRPQVRNQRRRLAECLEMLGKLEQKVSESVGSLSTQMLELMKCVTPEQTAKFLVWIEKNQACMYMLNNLWRTEEAAGAGGAAASAAAVAAAGAGAGASAARSPALSAGAAAAGAGRGAGAGAAAAQAAIVSPAGGAGSGGDGRAPVAVPVAAPAPVAPASETGATTRRRATRSRAAAAPSPPAVPVAPIGVPAGKDLDLAQRMLHAAVVSPVSNGV